VALGSRLGQGGVGVGVVSDRGDGDLGAGRGGAPIRVGVPIGRDASGGPLIATHFTVVGVGTAAFDPGGAGAGLAIAAELVRREVTALAAAGGGRIAHGWPGALTQPLDARRAGRRRGAGRATASRQGARGLRMTWTALPITSAEGFSPSVRWACQPAPNPAARRRPASSHGFPVLPFVICTLA
jgi:S1-C subfamily serine protease